MSNMWRALFAKCAACGIQASEIGLVHMPDKHFNCTKLLSQIDESLPFTQ